MQQVPQVKLIEGFSFTFPLFIITLQVSISTFLPSILPFFYYLFVSYSGIEIFSSLVVVGLIFLIYYLALIRISLLLNFLIDFLFLAVRQVVRKFFLGSLSFIRLSKQFFSVIDTLYLKFFNKVIVFYKLLKFIIELILSIRVLIFQFAKLLAQYAQPKVQVLQIFNNFYLITSSRLILYFNYAVNLVKFIRCR